MDHDHADEAHHHRHAREGRRVEEQLDEHPRMEPEVDEMVHQHLGLLGRRLIVMVVIITRRGAFVQWYPKIPLNRP